MSVQFNSKVASATKWSVITEILAKLVSPLSTMVLARLLSPDAFGILVTSTMVVSFAQIFTDAGFQKYIIQHNFKDDDALYQSVSVAFWSNLIMSVAIWAFICIFCQPIAHLVGNDGYGIVVAVSCVCLPLAAFSSIQMALFKRALDFKTLFIVRIVGILIPLVVTIPLAFITRSYWSLIVGMILLELCNAVILTWKSQWKPKWFYRISLFREMFSFTAWSMIEAVSIWLTSYLDVFVVGTVLSAYYVGVYRTGINTVGQIMSIITAATTPVLFSALSRLQDDEGEFRRVFFKFQRLVAILVIPFGVGIFVFKDLVTDVLLGKQWGEASFLIGWWGLTSSITIVLAHYCSEVFRAKGKPKYSFFAQIVHLCFLIPTVLISVNYGFKCLCLSRSLVRLTLIMINLILLYSLTRITPFDMFRNIWHPIVASLAMLILGLILPETDNLVLRSIEALLCAVIYLAFMMIWKSERTAMLQLKRYISMKMKLGNN